MRVIVDATGHLVGNAYTDSVPEPGQQIVDVSNADYELLQRGDWHWESNEAVIASNNAWRNSTRAQQVLDLTGDLTGNLLRNWAQDITRITQRYGRQFNTFHRGGISDGISPNLVEDDNPDAGPGDE